LEGVGVEGRQGAQMVALHRRGEAAGLTLFSRAGEIVCT